VPTNGCGLLKLTLAEEVASINSIRRSAAVNICGHGAPVTAFNNWAETWNTAYRRGYGFGRYYTACPNTAVD
jgi:hypothetical protein